MGRIQIVMAERLLLPLLLLFMLQGCSLTPSSEDESEVTPSRDALVVGEIEEALRSGRGEQGAADSATEEREIPAAVNEELLPPLVVNVPDAPNVNLEPRFNVMVRDLPAEEFFLGLVEGTPYSVVLAPGVEGSITLSLQSVTVPEVLETVRDVYGYDYQPVPGGYMILSTAIRTRIFQLDYLNIKRDGSSSTMISFGQLSGDGDNAELSGSEVSTTTQADFWSELQTTLVSIVGTGEGRKVVISPQTGVIAVHALPTELRSVEQFIETLQSNLRRQVLLEAKILEVELKDGYQSGVNWAALFEPGSGKSIVAGQTGRSGGVFDSATGVVSSNSPGTGKFSQVELDTGAFGGVFSLAFNLNDFTALIELLETQGVVRVLSSPRVSTINNQKAVIKVGTDEFFVTDVGTVTTTGTSTNIEQDVELTPFFSGISLDVTPQINRNGEVVLHVHPSVVEVSDDSKVLPTSTTAVPLAKSSVRESDSIVIAQNGQVVVIGGLMKTTQKESEATTPGLSSLPLVGGMFGHERTSLKKLELVILIRPTVISGQEQWHSELQQTARRFRRLNMDE